MGATAGRVYLLLAVLAAAGCGKDHLQRVESRLVAEPLDFGQVEVGAHQTKRVRLHNEGLGTVQVRGIRAVAPFTGLQLQEPLSIPGGETREVELGFAPDGEGLLQQIAAVDSDAQSVKQPLLKGFGAHLVVAFDPGVLDFGGVPLDTQRTLSVLVQNRGNVEAQVKLDALEGIDAELYKADPPATIPPHGQAALPVTVVAHHLGPILGTLTVRGCPTCTAERIALKASGLSGALTASPDHLDFGTVSVGSRAEQGVELINESATPVDLSQLFITAGSDADFSTTAAPLTLAPGEHARIQVQFAAQAAGTRHGTLRVVSNDPLTPQLDVALQGVGDASATVVDPRSLDFGEVAVGLSSTRQVTVYNTSATRTLTVLSARITRGARFAGGIAAAQAIQPGDHLTMPVAYAPTQAVQEAGTLEIVTDEGGQTTVDVALTGQGLQLPPCSWTAFPAALDFGTANPGETRVLSVDLKNTGTHDCAFTDIALGGASDRAFAQPDGPIASALLHPGEWATVRVSFDPGLAGSFSGNLQFFVSNPASPVGQVALSGQAAVGCLRLHPVATDFGAVSTQCQASQKIIQAQNVCAAPLTIAQVALGAGDTQAFHVVSGNTAAHSLAPGAVESFTVSYLPTDDSLVNQSLNFTLADGTVVLASLQGVGVTGSRQTDRFTQADKPKVDQLFVIDNSGSMTDKQGQLAASAHSFLAQALADHLDFHIAVTTTGLIPASGGWTMCPGGAQGGENGRFFPVDGSSPRILDPGTPNLESAFATNMQVGTCHWLEQGLGGAKAALSQPLVDEVDDPTTPQPNDGNAGFLRPDARLSIVVVSDSDDQSPGEVADYLNFFRGLKGGREDQFIFSTITTPDDKANCVSGESPGDRYMALAQLTGGAAENVCSGDWGGTMARIAASAFGPLARFKLSARPLTPFQIEVRVNGHVVTTGYRYDGADNAIVFDAASVPAAGSTVELDYPVGC